RERASGKREVFRQTDYLHEVGRPEIRERIDADVRDLGPRVEICRPALRTAADIEHEPVSAAELGELAAVLPIADREVAFGICRVSGEAVHLDLVPGAPQCRAIAARVGGREIEPETPAL